MNLQEKETLASELTSTMGQAQLAILVNYEGITCENIVKLRRQLAPSGSKFKVVKNTIAKRALKGTDAEQLAEFFQGPTGVIWSADDPVAPSKVVAEFAKANEKFVIKAGVIDGSVLTADGVKQLAAMPSREQLLGKLLGLINAPATRLLQTINAPASSLARLLGAWKEEIEKKGE